METNRARANALALDRAVQERTRREEEDLARAVHAHGQELLAQQAGRRRPTAGVRKANYGAGLEARGASLMASDKSGIRLHRVARDTFCRPIDSRERLSLNWDA